MYTLEAHLESFQEEEFKILNAIWKLNKKNLPQAQSAISFNFPHYSLHEKTHSDTIVRNIESYLGQRIKNLSPTDTWLILMSAHTHDLGMIVFSKTIERLWPGETFLEYLKDIATSSSLDNDLVVAANFIIQLTAEKSDVKDLVNVVLGIRRALILIISNHFRSTHHASSRQMIMREDPEFANMVSGLIMEKLPNRFTNTLANIAYSHGVEFYQVLDILENEADGIGSDKMHPRFIACLLRLGDLLDVDDKRFSSFNEKMIEPIPAISQQHKEKHASIQHLLISPRGIEITADCKSDEVYRIAREWFDWLEEEVEYQTKEWSQIAPGDFPGLPPMISKGKIKVLHNSVIVPDELMNLRFQISNKRIFEIIEGQALYEEAGLVFIRELVQNALDASKAQLWKMIQEGIYDELIKINPLFIPDPTKTISDQIKFPFHIPPQVYSAFEIELNISWSSPAKDELLVEVTDRGTGISKADLLRMTSEVGENKNAGLAERTLIKAMPKFLQPTGAFGIGLQSIFHVAASFTAKTKSEGEMEKEIVFRSARRGEYCRMSEYNGTRKRGTTITVNINKTLLSTLLPSRLPASVIESEDVFDKDYSVFFLPYLRHYLLEEFSNTHLLKINYFGNIIKPAAFSNTQNGTFYLDPKTAVHEKDISCFINKKYNYHELTVFEDILGSDIKLSFLPELITRNRRSEAYEYAPSGYLVRDIPVDETFLSHSKIKYCQILWNLHSSSSDKILNISRDKFIKVKREKIDREFLNNILPRAISVIIQCFINYAGETVDEHTTNEYFNILLTCDMCGGVQKSDFPGFLKGKEIPVKTAIYTDGSPLPFKRFFDEETFFKLHVVKSINPISRASIERLWESVRDTDADYHSGILLIVFKYFSPYLRVKGFVVDAFKVLEIDGYRIALTTYRKTPRNASLKISEKEKKVIFSVLPNSYRGTKRDYFRPYDPYAAVLAVEPEKLETFESIPNFTRYFIVSPFRNYDDFIRMATLIKEKETTDLLLLIRLIINEPLFNEIITPALIAYIQNHNPFEKNQTEQKIKEMYAQFIVDYVTFAPHSQIREANKGLT
ncbi:Histidine kinase-, DNA gyrase B-, and HSP90-like ATPase [Chitinophaga rupis]|uniref:Histidine kinase-, DNA gyrase B-, and HSP90-like ATPase n=1 Tax=Chitinophaga rupis TaxID=573321 RepID=A0A1H7RX54_9BACT|nr:ATP-binding protein [Chitinophaga rupis]SEL63977.1 Histidine kinase-, DNA gyrase B-, and HSP90-like ATPase [Chitinophaga rupis]